MNSKNEINPILTDLKERKSIRVFEDRSIPAEAQKAILLAAAAAPTAGNQQLYSILTITDQSLKDRLAVTCDNQPFIARSPFILIFCADCQKWYEAYKAVGCHPRIPSVGDLMLAVEDSSIAAQNAVTAAWSLGIGSCYIGDIMENCEIHRELLHLPEFVFPAVMLVFGYPTKQQSDRKKPVRCDLSHIVMENFYSQKSEAELEAMFRHKSGVQSYQDWMTAFCTRKYNSDFSAEMGRSVGEYLKNFK